ncbi:uncharacterized protein LOC144876035 isoform X2 [Branchiostoma floridae x Branchiostoma japonicum]
MAETRDANELLWQASEKGSLQGVKTALKSGADIDFDHADCEGCSGTALYVASTVGHVDIVRLLLRKGASLVKRAKTSAAPLHVAAIEGKTEVVDLLVQHGATLDTHDGWQKTPLMVAFSYNRVDTVRRLIELGARPDLVTDDYIATMLKYLDCDESLKLIQEARKSKLLRCCNPKCGKPDYRSALKLCGGCKLTRYCSRDCQKQHWSVGHKRCCGHDVYTGERSNALQTFVKHLQDKYLQNTTSKT